MKNFFSRYKIWQWIIIILMASINIFIIVNSCLQGKESTDESNWLVNIFVTIINGIKKDTINDSNIGSFSFFVRKVVGHFSLFLVSGLLTASSVKFFYFDVKKRFWIYVLISLSIGLFLAGLTELIQLFVPGRSGQITDVLIDFSGYFIGGLIIFLIVFFQDRKNRSIENNKELL